MKIIIHFCTFIACILLTSCSVSNYGQGAPRYTRQTSMPSSKTGKTKNKALRVQQGTTAVSAKKMQVSARLELEVEDPEIASIAIKDIAEKHEGYLRRMDKRRVTIRIPNTALDAVIEDIGTLGEITDKAFTGVDVTNEFFDYKVRLDNAEKSRERYLELLSKAENVEAALKVELELERLNETIDLLKGEIKHLQHLSEFSTISIRLEEQHSPGILGYVFIGLYESVKWLFVRD
jgi:hypothetical protein